MDLRVSVVLLFVFCAGGFSLKCYTCSSLTGSCDANETTCQAGEKCMSQTTGSLIKKGCVATCVQGATEIGGIGYKCCGTDLCNAADGLSTGNFLLLLTPLLFYFLFQ